MSEFRIELKKGSAKLVADREELVGVSETHEGLVFNFKGGMNVVIHDDYMSSSVKKRVTNADRQFAEGNLIFDMDNPRAPVLVDTT